MDGYTLQNMLLTFMCVNLRACVTLVIRKIPFFKKSLCYFWYTTAWMINYECHPVTGLVLFCAGTCMSWPGGDFWMRIKLPGWFIWNNIGQGTQWWLITITRCHSINLHRRHDFLYNIMIWQGKIK